MGMTAGGSSCVVVVTRQKLLICVIPVFLFVIFFLQRTSYIPTSCGMVFHGSASRFSGIKGSCWCGSEDAYCMCTPSLAIDCILFSSDDQDKQGIWLVDRGRPPYGFAIVGGFVDVGESVEDAARREVKEETGLHIDALEQFRVYSNPDRDPRRHTVSVVFVAQTRGKPRAGDDAKAMKFVPLSEVQDVRFAFDHGDIVNDYLVGIGYDLSGKS